MEVWTYLLEKLKRHEVAVYMDTWEILKEPYKRTKFHLLEILLDLTL